MMMTESSMKFGTNSALQRLIEDGFAEDNPCVLLTAKGMPDFATRVFLHKLKRCFPHLPAFGQPSSSLPPFKKYKTKEASEALFKRNATGLLCFNLSVKAVMTASFF